MRAVALLCALPTCLFFAASCSQDGEETDTGMSSERGAEGSCNTDGWLAEAREQFKSEYSASAARSNSETPPYDDNCLPLVDKSCTSVCDCKFVSISQCFIVGANAEVAWVSWKGFGLDSKTGLCGHAQECGFAANVNHLSLVCLDGECMSEATDHVSGDDHALQSNYRDLLQK